MEMPLVLQTYFVINQYWSIGKIFPYLDSLSNGHFTSNQKWQPHGGARGKVRDSPKAKRSLEKCQFNFIYSINSELSQDTLQIE